MQQERVARADTEGRDRLVGRADRDRDRRGLLPAELGGLPRELRRGDHELGGVRARRAGDDDLVADRPVAEALADGDDDARGIRPEPTRTGDRLRRTRARSELPVDGVHADGAHLDEDLAVRGQRMGDLAVLEDLWAPDAVVLDGVGHSGPLGGAGGGSGAARHGPVRSRGGAVATRPPYPGRIRPRWGVTNRVPRRAGALRAHTQESPLRCAHARDERPRAGVGAARDGRRGIRRIRGRRRRTGRCGARAVVEPVRGRRLVPDRPRPAVGEGCRDRAVRHGRQGRAAHRHRDRPRGGLRGGGRARGAASAVGTRPGGAHRRGRRGGGDDPRQRLDARLRPLGHRGDRGDPRTAVPRAAPAGRGCRAPRRMPRRSGAAPGRPPAPAPSAGTAPEPACRPPPLPHVGGRRGRDRRTRRVRRIRAAGGLARRHRHPGHDHASQADCDGDRPAVGGTGHRGTDPGRHAERAVLPDRHGARGAGGRSVDVEPAHPRHGRPGGDAHLGRTARPPARGERHDPRVRVERGRRRPDRQRGVARIPDPRAPRARGPDLRTPTWSCPAASTASRRRPRSPCSRTTATRSSRSA